MTATPTLALALDARQLMLELHGILRDLDSSSWRNELAAGAHARLAELRARFAELSERCQRDERYLALAERMAELSRTVEQHMPRLELPQSRLRDEWLGFGNRLQDAYAEMVAGLRQHRVRVPDVRATNWTRSLIHVSGALVGLLCVALLPPALLIPVAGVFFVYAWTMELARRRMPRLNERLMAFYAPIAHAHEHHRINSATWYCTALLLLGTLAALVNPLYSALGLVVLGFGDPAASTVGRRWGRIRLLHGRTLEGTLTFVGVGLVAALVLGLTLFSLPVGTAALLALAAATTGALAELVSARIDDNLAIPVVAAVGVWGMAVLIG